MTDEQQTTKDIAFIDLDDTKVNRRDHPIACYISAFKDFQVAVTAKELLSCHDFTHLIREKGIDFHSFWERYNQYDTPESRHAAIKEKLITLYHDTIPFLEAMRETVDCIITSNTPPSKALIQIDHLGLRPYFPPEKTVLYDFANKQEKPKPSIEFSLRGLAAAGYPKDRLEEIARRATTDPPHIWVIGDSDDDINLAINLRSYLTQHRLFFPVHSIHIERRGQSRSHPDYVAFGPHPLLTAATIITTHTICHGNTSPIYVCAPDLESLDR